MKIVQICLCGMYNPKMGYQDNILPKYYNKLGLECVTITNQYYKEEGKIIRDTRYHTVMDDSNKIIRLKNKFNLNYKINRIPRLYSGLYKALEKEKPNIIFLHNFQFLSIYDVVKYCKKNKHVKVYADSHTDYVNSATNWLSKNILHKVIWRMCTYIIEPYVTKFWGVTEQRCRFMNEIYKVPSEKIDLLIMGGDDEKIKFESRVQIKKRIRKELLIDNNDFVIITGGKIDEDKNIHLLAKSIKSLNNKKIKLVIFGEIKKEMKELFDEFINYENIIYIGWINSDEVYDYFLASDLGVFPGTHSVLWEQSVATGLPCIFKKWDEMQHVDIGGNCIFIESVNVEELTKHIEKIYINKDVYNEMLVNANKKEKERFLYSNIAKRSIEK